ncbi:hypothetical protein KKH23_06700 [Patescibacteria group bacterium]|nr:hypothetical protein [Patescibacteria group bacterium]
MTEDMPTTTGEAHTMDIREQMVALREEGLSYAKIAQRMEISKSCVAKLAMKYLPPHLRKRQSWKVGVMTSRSEMVRLDKLGWSDQQIADKQGCPRYYVRQVLREAEYDERAGDRTRCIRCDSPAENDNPIDEHGHCLLCQLDLAGVNLMNCRANGQTVTETRAILYGNTTTAAIEGV